MKAMAYLKVAGWFVWFLVCYVAFFALFQFGPSGFVEGLKAQPSELSKLFSNNNTIAP